MNPAAHKAKRVAISVLAAGLFSGSATAADQYIPFGGIRLGSISVIGTGIYGGYMDYFIRGTGAERIHISDLGYYSRMERIEKGLDYYRGRFPHKRITISDGTDTPERLAEADLVCITGSALCTGTMDELLEWSQNCRTIIVQGQSGAIHPEVLFERGVTMVSTTLKPDNFIDLAVNDQKRWRELLEGKLPTIYMRRK